MPIGEVLPQRLLSVTLQGSINFVPFDESSSLGRCLDALELMLRTQTSPTETAAIILEPVLGEGGYVPCPPGYLLGVQNICKRFDFLLLLPHLAHRNNILLIVDEVQTGFGRTGEMFASDWLDNGAINPDILIMAKGIANGFPLSAIATRSEISAPQPPGDSYFS